MRRVWHSECCAEGVAQLEVACMAGAGSWGLGHIKNMKIKINIFKLCKIWFFDLSFCFLKIQHIFKNKIIVNNKIFKDVIRI